MFLVVPHWCVHYISLTTGRADTGSRGRIATFLWLHTNAVFLPGRETGTLQMAGPPKTVLVHNRFTGVAHILTETSTRYNLFLVQRIAHRSVEGADEMFELG